MIKTTMRGLIAHKLRLGLTSVAIVLAVGFVSGTYIFTDSLQQAFTALVGTRVPDVVVSPRAEFGARLDENVAVRTLPADLVGEIAAVPSVGDAVGWVRVRNVALLAPDGKPISGHDGPGGSSQGQSWIDNADLAVVTPNTGNPPSGPDEVAIDTTTATQWGFRVGDPVQIVLPDGRIVRPRISALVDRGISGGIGGASSVAVWDLPTAQSLLLEPGRITQVRVQDTAGASQQDVADAITKLVPAGTEVKTGQQIADTTSQDLADRLAFLNTFLLVFALIALFVSSFLIYNTFSMLVAQRTREVALLRAIGATKAQVTRSVLLEAAIVGVLATTVGIALGVGVAAGLRGMFEAFGDPLPGSGFSLQPRTIWVSYGIGVLVTVISAWVPSRRAASTAPVAALRDDPTLAPRGLRVRTAFGAAFVAIGAGLAFGGIAIADSDGNRAASLIGLSALTVLVGLLMLAPTLARIIVPALALPVRRLVIGKIARENARRNPRRTAATAGALMIGLTLMTAISVLAASVTASTNAVVDQVVGADFVMFGDNYRPFPNAASRAVQGTSGTAAVTNVRSTPAKTPGSPDGTLVVGVDPSQITSAVNLEMTAATMSDLVDGTVILDSRTAADEGLGVGSTVEMATAAGSFPVEIVGLYTPSGFYQGYVTTLHQVDAMGATGLDTATYIKLAPGADQQAVRADLEERLKPYPTVTLQDQTQFKEQIADQVSQLLRFIFALLVLAVIIAVLGIVNTLSLSVLERTREIGLLRAVGTLRSQIRRMIAVESILIAVFGALLGIALGIGYGVLLQRALASQGIGELGVDGAQLAWFLAAAGIAGLVAALWPAWRASRLNLLRAIASE